MFVVYKVTNVINGKSYIGKTSRTLKKRRKEHIAKAAQGSSLPFHAAIRKYGEKNFLWDIIAECESIDTLNRVESLLIHENNTLLQRLIFVMSCENI